MSGAGFFQEFTLDQSQTQSVEDAIAQMQALVAEVRVIRDELASSVTGDLTAADVARLLTARDEAVAAAGSVEGIATTVNDAVVVVTNAAAAAAGYRAGAAASEAAAVTAANNSQANAAASGVQAAAALTAAGNSQAQADRSSAFANSPPDFEVEPGKYGVPHYYERVRLAAEGGSPFERITYVDADLTAGKYTLRPVDLGKLVVFNVSAPTEIVFPVDLFTTRSASGGPMEDWIRIRLHRTATGSLTFVSPGSAVVQQVAPTAHTVFTAVHEPPVTSPVKVFTFTVPAGTNRRAGFQMLSLFSAAKVGRDSTLTVSGSSNLSKIQADTAENSSGGANPINVAVWKADLGTSSVPTSHTLTLTPDGGVLAVALICDAAINSVGVVQAVVTSNNGSAPSGTVAVAINPAEDKGMVVATTAHQGADAQPLTPGSVSGAEVLDNRKTDSTRALRDFSFVTHRHQNVVTGSRSYSSVSAKVGRGSGVALVFKPDTVTTVSTTIIGDDQITVPGGSRTIMAASDGVTYHVDL